ncbi:MAG: HD domain-containing protein [Phycisphaerae bacterium]|nr:HD domain-containing protein [Phycisphaerae bacterium]
MVNTTQPKAMLDGQAEVLLTALRVKSLTTYEHCLRVAEMVGDLAERMNFGEDQTRQLTTAALLHDIGKMTIPSSILTKADELDPGEFYRIQGHARMGHALLNRLHGFDEIAHIVRHHHERWDGEGYPAGLAGVEIPLASRVIHLADAVDTMLHPRSYKAAYPMEWVLGELNRCRGGQFDPHVVDVAAAWLERQLVAPRKLAQAA